MVRSHKKAALGVLPALGALLALGAPQMAKANPADMFGLGGKAMGMGSAFTGQADDPMATYYNTAGLAKQKELDLTFGLQMGSYMLGNPANCPEPSGMVGCSDPYLYDRGGVMYTEQLRYGYDNPHNFQLGLAIPLHDRVTMGLGVALPVDVKYGAEGNLEGVGMSLIRIQTIDPYLPHYVMYRNRANRFAMYSGFGIEVMEGLSVGVGATIAAAAQLDIQAGGDITLTSETANEDVAATVLLGIDTQMAMSMATTAAPVAGVMWDMDMISDKLEGWSLGLSYRGESGIDVTGDIATDMTVYADLGEDSDPIAIRIAADDIYLALTEFYTPRQASLGLSTQWGERFTGNIDVSWIQWSALKLPVATLGADIDPAFGVAIETVPARNLDGVQFYDTVVPKLGVEYRLGSFLTASKLRGLDVALRAGGSYEANPVPVQSSFSNLLNSDRVTGTFGVGLRSGNPFMTTQDKAIEVDFYMQTHYLLPTAHTKSTSAFGSTDPTTVDGFPVNGVHTSQGLIVLGGATVSLFF